MRKADRTGVSVAALWALGVAGALAFTLAGIRSGNFDGLNNATQMPFALPWLLIPIGTRDQVVNAWELAACGWLNAVLIYMWIAYLRRTTPN